MEASFCQSGPTMVPVWGHLKASVTGCVLLGHPLVSSILAKSLGLEWDSMLDLALRTWRPR